MYKKALVPLDGSDLAEYALSHVSSLAEEGSIGEVTLLTVVNVDLPRTDEYPIRIDLDALRQPLFRASAKYLAGAESRLSTSGVTVKTESIEAKKPAKAITYYAQKNGMDLIVMSTHGYTGLKKLLLGCVGAEVLSQSLVPVLLIRPEACHMEHQTNGLP